MICLHKALINESIFNKSKWLEMKDILDPEEIELFRQYNY